MSTVSTSNDFNVDNSGSSWIFPAIIGSLSILVGVLLLFNLGAAVGTLVIFIGISLILGGIGEVVLAENRNLANWALGLVLIIGGLVVFAWPGMTLWALAFTAGVAVAMTGFARIFISIFERAEVNNWGLKLLGGVVGVVVGITAIAWPGATVALLALLFGARIAFMGVVAVITAIELPRSKSFNNVER